MIKEIIDFFQDDEGKAFYQQLPADVININNIEKLLKQYPEKPIRQLLTLKKLQKQASNRIKESTNFIFTIKGVQQSSSTLLAEYHSKKMEHFETVADLCCGNGIDLHHIAVGKKQVWAVDFDKETLLAAKYNNSKHKNIKYLKIIAQDFTKKVEAIFIDPDRRSGKRRLVEAEDLSPSLSEVLEMQKITPNILVKLSPAMDYKNLYISVDHSWEFISENGELKEILLCLGMFAQKRNKAVLLPKKVELIANNEKIDVSKIKKYLLEPDVAIIRAGMVQDLGALFNANLIDEHLALLTFPEEIYSDYFKTYEVIDEINFNRKLLQKYLREKSIGKLVIKTRGFNQSVEQFRKKIKLTGEKSALMFILRIGKGHRIIFAKIKENR